MILYFLYLFLLLSSLLLLSLLGKGWEGGGWRVEGVGDEEYTNPLMQIDSSYSDIQYYSIQKQPP